ncbi:MAG: threonylcarbamoyl-AMP synthase [Acidobacteria bacterium RIFCSPLOWO2_02_FULL_59_13]|nr:MAG: threonylcarbamoyl-AMP synthase [Acidobacteria bacterium RIFCSPLOWO2_02_FULL_59_13]
MAEIWKVDPNNPESWLIARAAERIGQGQVLAIPTDTFYGLAANPFDAAAIENVFAIKGRPKNAPLLLLVDSVEMARELSPDLPDTFFLLAKRFWPGPLTLVVPASFELAPEVTAGTGRVGLRLPAAAIAVALIGAASCPLTATSANLSGQKECSTAQQVNDCLGDRLPLILDGGTSPQSRPSTVVKLEGKGWEILREGAVPGAEIARFLKGC